MNSSVTMSDRCPWIIFIFGELAGSNINIYSNIMSQYLPIITLSQQFQSELVNHLMCFFWHEQLIKPTKVMPTLVSFLWKYYCFWSRGVLHNCEETQNWVMTWLCCSWVTDYWCKKTQYIFINHHYRFLWKLN